MMPQPIAAPESGATQPKIASTTPSAKTASPSIMQVMERFDQSGIKWKKWLQRFENAVEVSGVSKVVKPKVLLHCIGAKAYDELTDLVAPAKPESMQYNELAEILTKHFEPERLEMVELWAFRSRTQQNEETIKDYVQALLHMANDCGFGDHIQKAVRNQFVFGIRNEKARLRLLQEKQLTLEKAKEIAMGMEAVEEEENKTNVVGKNEKFEKKINFLSRDCYNSWKSSIDKFIDDLLNAMSDYYEKNNGVALDCSYNIEGNNLYLTIEPEQVDGKKKPGSSLRAIAYK